MPTSVDAIPVNTHYLGPTAALQNPCLCSSVTYSLVSACGGCQGRTFQNWTTWNENCLNPSLTTFPDPLPATVQVPVWASLNVTLTGDTLDPVAAQNALSGIAPPALTSSSTTSNTPTPSATTTTSPTVTSATTEKKHSNAGAIAGGVVGGLVFLAAVVLGVLWWFMHKRRNAIQQDLTFDSRALVSAPVMSQVTGSSRSPDGPSPVPFSQSLYDTSDASTFPMSPVTSGVYTTLPAGRRSVESVSQSLAQFGGYQTPSQQPGGYRGP
ncbi:hypothetical protein BDZ97DRAFT_1792984, partial [Flammula alnicola]